MRIGRVIASSLLLAAVPVLARAEPPAAGEKPQPGDALEPGGAPEARAAPQVGDAQPGPPVLTLADAQALARRENYSVQIVAERLARAQATARRAWGAVLPVVTGNGSWGRNNRAVTFTLPDGTNITIQRLFDLTAGAALSWPIANGRAIPLVKNAYASVDLAQLSLSEAHGILMYATALAYYNVLNAERQVDVRLRAVANAQAHLRLEQSRLAVGTSTEVAVLRADTELATQEQALIQARNTARLSKVSLAVLIGRVGNDGSFADFRVERPPEPPPQVPTRAELLKLAYSDRLDLRQRYLQLTIDERFKTDTWMQFLPVLSIVGNYQWTQTPGFVGTNSIWRVALNLSWTIFDAGQRIFELQERQHDINMAELDIAQMRRDIAQEVTQATLDLESAIAAHDAASRRAELAARSARIVAAQYEVGAATQLDLLDADRTLADADAAEAVAQLNVDAARLAVSQVTLTSINTTTTAGVAGAGNAGTAAASAVSEAVTTATPSATGGVLITPAGAAGAGSTPTGAETGAAGPPAF